MLSKLYNKSKIWFAVAWIIAYCLLMSVGDSLSAEVGIEKVVTLPVGFLLSVVLFVFLKKNNLLESHGFCRSQASARSMLFYLPAFAMLALNLCYGVRLNYGLPETALYILSMLCVGFLEEVIFRGLLFGAMREDNLKVAILVSSLTFGIGHIINLINGSGAQLVPNLLQVLYATTAGFMFVMMYIRTKSLLGCIAFHGIFNALSVFSSEATASVETRIITGLILALITGGYALYLVVYNKKTQS